LSLVASTLDGRVAESTTDLRAFQPFFAEMDPPAVLTQGDEILLPVPVRNFLDTAQTVQVEVEAPPSLVLTSKPRAHLSVPSGSSASAVVGLRAGSADRAARLRLSAGGASAADVIEKQVAIRPDGERAELTVTGLLFGDDSLLLQVPTEAIPGSTEAELVIYPSMLSRLLGAADALLERPHGCGEQTISTSYPNLLLLQSLKKSKVDAPDLRRKAMRFLNLGYQRLLGYQDSSGGFTYWGKGNPDAALTAYAIEFLTDAADFIEVDAERVAQAKTWMSTIPATSPGRHRALSMRYAVGAELRDFETHFAGLAREAVSVKDSYLAASLALSAIQAGKTELARPVIEELVKMALKEDGVAWWTVQGMSTPFYGWGKTGDVETTSLAVSALTAWGKAGGGVAGTAELIQRASLFLLRQADAAGAWASSQASSRALLALLEVPGLVGGASGEFQVTVNGKPAGAVRVPGPGVLRGPIRLDLTGFLQPGAPAAVKLAGLGGHALQVQISASWYKPWQGPRHSGSLRLETSFSRLNAETNELIRCDVSIHRPTPSGMLIAEIGLPPGADVDRASLSALLDRPGMGIDSFEVAPDRVTVYVWPRLSDTGFHFYFRPRFAMKALSAPSALYDFYNPAERTVLPPVRFEVVSRSARRSD
jgi:hypothetical protein